MLVLLRPRLCNVMRVSCFVHSQTPEKEVSLSEAVLLELEETKAENRRLHNLNAEFHQRHHEITLKVTLSGSNSSQSKLYIGRHFW